MESLIMFDSFNNKEDSFISSRSIYRSELSNEDLEFKDNLMMKLVKIYI